MTNTRVSAEPVALTVNGKERSVPAGSTMEQLLESLRIDPRMVVVEHNREIIRDRGALAVRPLAAGDRIEIVHFVGGG